MDEYSFRGQPISGLSAYVLLGSVKRVMIECPNPTLEDILALDTIVKDFDKKVAESFEEARKIEDICANVIDQNPTQVKQLWEGKTAGLGFLVGQVMKETKGSIDPRIVNDTIKELLGIK